MAELSPNCFVRYVPVKKREIKPVESGTINPEPIPNNALTVISCHIFCGKHVQDAAQREDHQSHLQQKDIIDLFRQFARQDDKRDDQEGRK